jgi:hypothetical protein
MLALGVLRYSQVVSCFLPIVYCNILNSKTNNKKLTSIDNRGDRIIWHRCA